MHLDSEGSSPLASSRPRFAFLVLFALTSVSCDCSESADGDEPGTAPPVAAAPRGNPALPGIDDVDTELQAALDDALAARGAGYTPRTRHLEGGAPRFTNRLIQEDSPYLLQHAHNPVNWFPWGDEAFARARAEGKPVLLSVGYATCHWCHVMERESFEDEEVATFLNEHFIAIKVDREERPDVDALYMTALQLLTRSGGWPMTVLLTPDREPFFAGTYLPPRDGERGVRRGLLTLLREVTERYRDDPDAIVSHAQELSQHMMAAMSPIPPTDAPREGQLRTATERLRQLFDPANGGFGRPPRFPQPSQLLHLLRQARRGVVSTAREEARMMAIGTLDGMARGGIHDHVGGGFHRYSTDELWLVPHFEKMLYDNAQLAEVYLEAYQFTGDERHAAVARDVLDYLARDMQSESGGFYAATDADSLGPDGEMEEGTYFTWTPSELEEALGPEDLAKVRPYLGLSGDANFEGRFILARAMTVGRAAAEVGMEEAAYRELLASAFLRLREARARRPAPLRDEKIITGWNGLAIAAFATGARVLGESRYLEVAGRAAEFVLEHLRREDGSFARRAVGTRAEYDAQLDDHAFFVHGLLALFEASGDARWLREALAVQAKQDELFAYEAGGYWGSTDDTLMARELPFDDGVVPSGNSMAYDNLLRLAAFTGQRTLRERADAIAARAGAHTSRAPLASLRLYAALDRTLDRPLEVVLAYRSEDDAREVLSELGASYLPAGSFVRGTDAELAAMQELIPWLEGKRVIGDAAFTVFVCEEGRCLLPASDLPTLRMQLAPFVSPPLPSP